MVFNILKKIGSGVVNTITKMIPGVGAVLKTVDETIKRMNNIQTNDDRVRKAVNQSKDFAEDLKKAITNAVNRAKEQYQRSVDAERIKDKEERDKIAKQHANNFKNAVNEIANAVAKVNPFVNTVNEIVKLAPKVADKKTEEMNEELNKSFNEIDLLDSEMRKGFEELSEPTRSEVIKIWNDIISAVKSRDPLKLMLALRNSLKLIPLSPISVPAILVIIRTAIVKGIMTRLNKIIGVIASIVGTSNFVFFIGEEALQVSGFAVYGAILSKDWEEAKRALQRYKELANQFNYWVEHYGWTTVIGFPAFKAYARAALTYAETQERIIDKRIEVLRFLKDNEFKQYWEESFKALKEGKPLPDTPLKSLFEGNISMPEEVETKLRTMKNEVKDLMAVARSFRSIGNYPALLEFLNRAERKLEEFADFVGTRKSFFEFFDRFNTEWSFVKNTSREIDLLRDSLSDLIQKETKLKVTVGPVSAQIFINGKLETIGFSYEANVKPGKYIIEARADGYVTASKEVEIKEGDKITVPIVLEKGTPKDGFLTIRSTPEAHVYIGGKFTGLKTPLIKHPLSPGRYTIKLEQLGYEDEIFDVFIREGEETLVEKELSKGRIERPEKARIYIDTTPEGAFVFINDIVHRFPTDTVVEVDPGIVKIRLEKSGFKTFETELDVEEGKSYEIRHKLEPLSEKISWDILITSEPSGAEILLDYVPTLKRTPAKLNLGKGTWTITLQLPGYLPVEKVITLE
jgi:hypothetical protein